MLWKLLAVMFLSNIDFLKVRPVFTVYDDHLGFDHFLLFGKIVNLVENNTVSKCYFIFVHFVTLKTKY